MSRSRGTSWTVRRILRKKRKVEIETENHWKKENIQLAMDTTLVNLRLINCQWTSISVYFTGERELKSCIWVEACMSCIWVDTYCLTSLCEHLFCTCEHTLLFDFSSLTGLDNKGTWTCFQNPNIDKIPLTTHTPILADWWIWWWQKV